jgi:acyl-coenzyme A synthetase/AMP-(fatty) acid ligase
MEQAKRLDQLLSKRESSLYEILQFWASTEFEKPYLYRSNGFYSYTEVHDISLKLADLMHRNSMIQEESILAVCTLNFEYLVYLIWACLAFGICLAFLPHNLDEDLTKSFMDKVGATSLITDIPELLNNSYSTSLNSLVKEAVNSMPAGITHFSSPVTAKNSAFIMHTSGTMGQSKWVKISQRQILCAIQALYRSGGLDHAINQVAYITPPLFHSYGLSSFLEYTFVGSAIALAPSAHALGVIGDLANQNLSSCITALEGVPDFYKLLSKFAKKIKLPHLQHLGFGGGKPDLNALQWCSEANLTLSCSIRYGMTETPSVVAHKVLTYPHSESWISSGKVLSIYDILIIDESGKSLGKNEEGEILIKGDCLALPYLGDAKAHYDYFATGDLGYLDANHELIITGRKSLFIKHKGFRISPEFIESALSAMNSVLDCRVLLQGSELVAEVVRQDASLSTEAVLNFLAPRVPSYAMPKFIVFVEHLPRTNSGKIQRH